MLIVQYKFVLWDLLSVKYLFVGFSAAFGESFEIQVRS